MARRKKPDEGGSSYSWMDTYGDLVTNLLCFFVLLYAFSSTDESKWNQLVIAFTGSPSSAVTPVFDVTFARQDAIEKVDNMVNYDNREDEDESDKKGEDEAISEGNITEEEAGESFDELYENILNFIEENQLQDNMSVIRTDNIITIRFGEVFLFHSGEATLISGGNELLGKIVNLIGQNENIVEKITIEGHTDNRPIHNSQFRSNWELSTSRAVNTLQKVLEFDVLEPKMLTASGCGEYWPVATNDTSEGRAKNRRVDFVIERIAID